MDYIAASNDRVVIHQAFKHLIVGGNALLYMGKDGIKNYPLNRYVVNRDGNGNVLEIVTKELVNKDVLGFDVNTETQILEELKIFKEKTIISVAHRINTLKNCDKIYNIDNGTIIDSGSFEKFSQIH